MINNMAGSQNCEIICRDMSLRLDLDSTAIVWEEVAVYLEPQANRKTEKLATQAFTTCHYGWSDQFGSLANCHAEKSFLLRLSSGILAAAIGFLGFRLVKWQRQANDFG